MKKFLSMTLLFVAVFSTFIACTSGDEEKPDEPQPKEEDKITIAQIAGVWESPENDLFFISISTQGKISYCFSRYVMGSGNGKLNNGKLVIENDYSGYSDELQINFKNNILEIKGEIKKRNTTEKENVQLTFKSVDENNIYSFMGEFWKPLSGLSPTYGSVQATLSFVGESTAQFKHYVVKTGKIIKESLWYYIPRSHHKRGNIIYVHKYEEPTPLIQVADYWIQDDLFERK